MQEATSRYFHRHKLLRNLVARRRLLWSIGVGLAILIGQPSQWQGSLTRSMTIAAVAASTDAANRRWRRRCVAGPMALLDSAAHRALTALAPASEWACSRAAGSCGRALEAIPGC